MGLRKFNIYNARVMGQKFEAKIRDLRVLYPLEQQRNIEAWRILLGFAEAAIASVKAELDRLESGGLLETGRTEGLINKRAVRKAVVAE